MKIFATNQIYQADKVTVANQRIPSDALMERAGGQVFNWLRANLKGNHKNIHIFCGIGNNGGDGLVVARLLNEQGYKVFVYVVAYGSTYSNDFSIQLDRLKKAKISSIHLNKDSNIPSLGSEDVVVDAIFGIGLNRFPDPWVCALIAAINESNAWVVSIDVPSGLFMEQAPITPNGIIRAHDVLSFQFPKLIFFLPQTGIYIQRWQVLDIGLDADFITETQTDFEFIDKTEVLSFYRLRNTFSHKGTYGHSLIIGGSYGKVGAVILASDSCIKAGSGLVTVFLPICGLYPIQTALPEIMAITDADERMLTDIKFDFDPTVVGIGIGMGTTERTQNALINFLSTYTLPLVVDADGLNILSQHQKLLDKLPGQSVLTPHPKELERLIGPWNNDFEKLEKTKVFSKKYDCIVVIKGAYTITIYQDNGYVNSTGNPGMATAGSGDVLTGIITGLIAQGYTPLQAAVLGVYLHGRAGDLAVEECGHQALTARGISNFLGKAFLDLSGAQ